MKKKLLTGFIIVLAAVFIYSEGNREVEPVRSRDIPKSEVPKGIVIAGPRSIASLPSIWLQENGSSGHIPPVAAVYYSSMDAMMASAQSGDVDFVLMPVNTAAVLYNKGFNICMMNVFQWGGLYLSTTDPSCRSWKDLAGKELFIPAKGTVPDLVTQLFLDDCGMAIGEDLDAVYSSHTEIAQLLAQGIASYAVDVQPFVTVHLQSVAEYRIISDYSTDWQEIAGEGFRMPGFCMICRNPDLLQQPELLNDVNEAFAAAVTAVVREPDAAGKLAEDFTGGNRDLIARSMGNSGLSCLPLTSVRQDVLRYFEVLLAMKPAVIGGKLPEEGVYFTYETE